MLFFFFLSSFCFWNILISGLNEFMERYRWVGISSSVWTVIEGWSSTQTTMQNFLHPCDRDLSSLICFMILSFYYIPHSGPLFTYHYTIWKKMDGIEHFWVHFYLQNKFNQQILFRRGDLVLWRMLRFTLNLKIDINKVNIVKYD